MARLMLALLLRPATAMRLGWAGEPRCDEAFRQTALSLVGCAALAHATFQPPSAAMAAAPSCSAECFRECNRDVPGNKAYCKSQCDDYCAADGAKGKNDVVRSDLTLSEPRTGAGQSSSSTGTHSARAAEGGGRGEER